MPIEYDMPDENGAKVRLVGFNADAVARHEDELWVERRLRDGWTVRSRVEQPGGWVKYTITKAPQ